ncbi:hypothetical protein HLB44_12465 [Aquincola sp. S2]|uniref:Uncharacterized protein n=1 Tax=Pseudaquabacterium terrae TaxID=2732868 RepID=A0ABX2EGR5_9BURK|nr:hypothetical protein [Aquabacterium terrae]NRF67798.1 hypothetical protein [Aquabacterium terrae]
MALSSILTTLRSFARSMAATVASRVAERVGSHFNAIKPSGPPPSTLKWPTTPPLGAKVEVGPDARELGRLQHVEHLPVDLRQCAEANLKRLPGLKGYLGTVGRGLEVMRLREMIPEERAAKEREKAKTGTPFYNWVPESTGKFSLDVHQAELFIGSKAHDDLIRIPIHDGPHRASVSLVRAGGLLAAGIDTPRMACFTQVAGSDAVYFRVGRDAVNAGHTQNGAWRAFPIGNGHHLIPSVGDSDGEMACELMMRMSRGEQLDEMVDPANPASWGRQPKSIAERWRARTGGREQVVRIPKGRKKPMPFDALVRDLRQGLHDHGCALLTATTGLSPRYLVLLDIQMHGDAQGVAIVADPHTATVTAVAFGPDQQSLVPPDCRYGESRLTAQFFTRDLKYSAVQEPAEPGEPSNQEPFPSAWS